MHTPYLRLYISMFVALALNLAVWSNSHGRHPQWPNVPEPPSERSITMSFLGDRELAFRVWSLALQNFGNTGGDFKPLNTYNYAALGQWFDLLDRLNPHSDLVPMLASYYFGSTQNPQQLPAVIAYLEKVGVSPEKEKWRWLAQAVFLARHRMKDMPEALRLSQKLASLYRPGMPAWTLQMQALITSEMGDKQAAYMLLKSMLATETDNMQGPEINFMIDYLCTKVLTLEQATHEAVCTGMNLHPAAPAK